MVELKMVIFLVLGAFIAGANLGVVITALVTANKKAAPEEYDESLY